jgi:HD-like signal output (HDOD) protein
MGFYAHGKDVTMFRWLRRLIAGPAATPAPPAAAPAAPVQAAPLPAAAASPPSSPPAAPPLSAPVSFEQLDRVDAAWHDWLFERAQGGGLELNGAEQQVLDALGAILAAQQSGAALVRRMPGLVPQLLQSLRSEAFSGSALARTISSDPVLVAAVVRLANSAQAGSGTAVASVEHAVILLGQEGLRQLITTVAFRPIVDVQSGFYTRRLAPRLWEHAERCAIAARYLALETGIDPFEAFLAGLLQNVGLLAVLRTLDQASEGEKRLASDIFLARLAADTRALSARIAREWNFPESVAQALLEQGTLRKGAVVSPLGRLLKLTGYLGKVRLLAEDGVLDEADATLFAGLPEEAGQGYLLLATSKP